jgi:hypothetical protein
MEYPDNVIEKNCHNYQGLKADLVLLMLQHNQGAAIATIMTATDGTISSGSELRSFHQLACPDERGRFGYSGRN